MKRSPLVVIFTTVFIDLVGFGIVIPVLPFYAYQVDEYRREYDNQRRAFHGGNNKW